MTNRERISAIRFSLVEQSIAAWPKEGCGMVICHAGETISRSLRNIAAESDRFLADPRDLYELEMLLEKPEYLPIATWHSHPRSGPWMSADDYHFALLRAEIEHVIVGRDRPPAPRVNYGALEGNGGPPPLVEEWVVRSWRVRPGSLQFWDVRP